MAAGTLETLLHAPLFSEELGISLARGTDDQLFRWFLASLLFGARMLGAIAARTYCAFERHGLTSPQAIRRAGFDVLVDPVMREGGYRRYDQVKSSQILKDCTELLEEYGGSLRRVHALARDPGDLEARLDAFYGVGPVTVNIFLRELRPWWAKADPAPLPTVLDEASRLALPLEHFPRKSLEFARLESGLLHLRLNRARKHPSKGPGPVLWAPSEPNELKSSHLETRMAP